MKRFYTLLAAASLMMPLAASAKPIIGPVTPVTASANVAVNLSAKVSSDASIQVCNLWVDLAEIGPMTVANGSASRSFTFASGGSRIAFVFCRDTQGGMSAGATTAINVSGAVQNSAPLGVPPQQEAKPVPKPVEKPVEKPILRPEPIKEPVKETAREPIKVPEPERKPEERPVPKPSAMTTNDRPTTPAGIGDIIKAECPEQAGADHPCRSVYYIGKDGKRHSFPNSGVFFSWYRNFNTVKEVPAEKLGTYDLGPNVMYRAGVKMVKFTTDPKVYAIGRGGVLRWIKSEELARAFYGNDWNRKIDDIPDTFIANYQMGAEIETTSDYNPEAEFNHSTE